MDPGGGIEIYENEFQALQPAQSGQQKVPGGGGKVLVELLNFDLSIRMARRLFTIDARTRLS